jgi:uncharacterized DUF497 family protein
MRFAWDEEKNQQLQAFRHISFEQIVLAIDDGRVVDVIQNPNQGRYKNQLFILVEIENYVYVVPVVTSESGEEFFLKTIYQSRFNTSCLSSIDNAAKAA